MTTPVRLIAFILSVFGLTAPVLAQNCEPLNEVRLAGVTITGVEAAEAGGFVLAGGRGGARNITDLPAFCRVAATLTPVVGSAIGIELWLPAADAWNGRFLALGNGGFAGSIGTNAMTDPLRRGYAVGATDTGHTSPGGDFLLDEAQRTDFAYRAVHELAEQSKRMIQTFYGRPEEYALFSGCSTGGRQALTAAQRYPLDFDGIVAGAPANYVSHLQGQQLWMSRVGHQTGSTPIPADKLRMVNDAVVRACDLNDGVRDLVIESPPACSFPPASLTCEGTTDGACLLPEEVETLRTLYEGPTTSEGALIFPGPVPGSESGWGQMTGAQPMALALDIYRYSVFGDENWNFEDFDPERDILYAAEVIGDEMDAADPNLGPLVENQGKLLLYHGWADPGITPYATIDYYEDAIQTLGASAADSIRLFMVPGMGHCGGGEGPSTFDTLSVIDDWVSSGTAPDRIVASRSRGGQVDRTRPLCPYPQIAVYGGTGSTDLAENFSCALP